MAIHIVTKLHTFTGVPVSLTTLLGQENRMWIGSLMIRSGSGNVGNVSWNDTHGQAGGYLAAEEAVSLNFGGDQILSDNLTLNGTTDDTVYVTLGVNAFYAEQGLI